MILGSVACAEAWLLCACKDDFATWYFTPHILSPSAARSAKLIPKFKRTKPSLLLLFALRHPSSTQANSFDTWHATLGGRRIWHIWRVAKSSTLLFTAPLPLNFENINTFIQRPGTISQLLQLSCGVPYSQCCLVLPGSSCHNIRVTKAEFLNISRNTSKLLKF